jgi:hypothetical protein
VIVCPLWHVGRRNEAGDDGSTVHVVESDVFCGEAAGDATDHATDHATVTRRTFMGDPVNGLRRRRARG